MQAAHQDPDERLVERVPRGRAELGQRVGRERHARGGLGNDHIGAVAAQLRVRRQVGHFAHRGAGAQLGHFFAFAKHLHLALRNDVEGASLFALAIQRLAEVIALPLGLGETMVNRKLTQCFSV